jgi:mannose-6-phosphate isomerase-like protein (cupin superfamily)
MQYVFNTSKPKRYEFPTHINDLVMDRAQAKCSEVFVVVIRPNSAPPLHKHDDTEQVFYVIEGAGRLTIGQDRKLFPVKAGDVVRIPVSTWHSIQASGDADLKYLCVDCFGADRPEEEPTWDDHVKVLCGQQGWDYDGVIAKRDARG